MGPLVIFAFDPTPEPLIELFQTVRGVDHQSGFKILLQGAKPAFNFSLIENRQLHPIAMVADRLFTSLIPITHCMGASTEYCALPIAGEINGYGSTMKPNG